MHKNFSLFLALRYLKPKRTYVSIITLISIIGVTLGVMVLIVVIAVMTGFEKKLQDLILGFEPPIQVEPRGGQIMWQDEDESGRWDNVLKAVRGVEQVSHASPYVAGQVLLQFGEEAERRQIGMSMMAVDFEDKDVVERLAKNVGEEDGAFDLGFESCVVSKQFAEKNLLGVGSRIEAFSTGDLGEVVGELLDAVDNDDLDEEAFRLRVRELTDTIQTPKDMEIKGLFDSMTYFNVLFVNLYTGQELYELDNNVHGLAVHIDDAFQADIVKKEIDAVLPPGWYASTWIERHEQRFATIRNERSMMYFILFFIVLVAAFSTMNTMITMTVQKRHEIGVMKALGARVSQIVWVFLGQGMIVGLIGSLAGLGLGRLLLEYRNPLRSWLSDSMGVEVFPEEMYGISEIPMQIVGSDMAIICISAFVLCALAALPPAYMVARLDPAKALRD